MTMEYLPFDSMDLSLTPLTMPEKIAVFEIVQALIDAKAKHPEWVTDPIHASGILAEEAGEVARASLDLSYGDDPQGALAELIRETSQVGAVAVRILAGAMAGKISPHKHFEAPKES